MQQMRWTFRAQTSNQTREREADRGRGRPGAAWGWFGKQALEDIAGSIISSLTELSCSLFWSRENQAIHSTLNYYQMESNQQSAAPSKRKAGKILLETTKKQNSISRDIWSRWFGSTWKSSFFSTLNSNNYVPLLSLLRFPPYFRGSFEVERSSSFNNHNNKNDKNDNNNNNNNNGNSNSNNHLTQKKDKDKKPKARKQSRNLQDQIAKEKLLEEQRLSSIL